MSTIIRCDGCQRELHDIDDRVIVEREDPTAFTYIPGLPPNGKSFHWCRDCALYAVAALEARAP